MKTSELCIKEESCTSNQQQYSDDEDEVRALEIAAERVRILETTVKEQDRIIDQATQALNISELYRQKNCQSNQSSEFSTEHLHAERLLLIASMY